jgi:hypothetical protein
MWLNSYASFALQLFASSSHSQLNASAVDFARRYLWGDPDWLIHTRAGEQTSNEERILHLTRSGRRNSVFFYGVSPSNPLAIEAAARVRQSHVSSLAKSLAKFPRAKTGSYKP